MRLNRYITGKVCHELFLIASYSQLGVNSGQLTVSEMCRGQTDLTPEQATYEVLQGRAHHHLFCQGCESVIHMDASMLLPWIWEIQLTELQLFWSVWQSP